MITCKLTNDDLVYWREALSQGPVRIENLYSFARACLHDLDVANDELLKYQILSKQDSGLKSAQEIDKSLYIQAYETAIKTVKDLKEENQTLSKVNETYKDNLEHHKRVIYLQDKEFVDIKGWNKDNPLKLESVSSYNDSQTILHHINVICERHNALVDLVSGSASRRDLSDIAIDNHSSRLDKLEEELARGRRLFNIKEEDKK